MDAEPELPKDYTWAEVYCDSKWKSWYLNESPQLDSLPYVVAFYPSGVKDVTPRYCTQISAHGIPLRMKGKGAAWWLHTICDISIVPADNCQESIKY